MLPKTPSQVASSKPCIFSTLGYILATLVVVWCALFVMLFGFTFGPVVSRAFLLSMLFSTVLAVLLMQPLSIIMSLYVVPPPPRQGNRWRVILTVCVIVVAPLRTTAVFAAWCYSPSFPG